MKPPVSLPTRIETQPQATVCGWVQNTRLGDHSEGRQGHFDLSERRSDEWNDVARSTLDRPRARTRRPKAEVDRRVQSLRGALSRRLPVANASPGRMPTSEPHRRRFVLASYASVQLGQGLGVPRLALSACLRHGICPTPLAHGLQGRSAASLPQCAQVNQLKADRGCHLRAPCEKRYSVESR